MRQAGVLLSALVTLFVHHHTDIPESSSSIKLAPVFSQPLLTKDVRDENSSYGRDKSLMQVDKVNELKGVARPEVPILAGLAVALASFVTYLCERGSKKRYKNIIGRDYDETGDDQ